MTLSDWQQVLRTVGVRPNTAARWALACQRHLDPALYSAGMDDVLALLPQVLHECQMFEQMEENLHYSAERLMQVWPTRFPTLASTAGYANNPQGLAEKVYGGRMGNTIAGYGWLFRGQGPLMFTGYDTFLQLEKLTEGTPDYQDFTVSPNVVAEPLFGLAAVRHWWEGNLPDSCLADTVKCRRRVNGARIGLEHCQQLADSCRRAFA